MSTLTFQRWLVILNGLVPGLMLLADAWWNRLGANSVNIALHITGILSLVFLLLSLLMTPLRTMTGWGGWIAFRRALGLYGFFYAAVHLMIYVVYDRAGSLQSTLNEIASRRFLLVGLMALLLMVPLAVTSTQGMIRRLGSVRWKRLHRLAYIATMLGVLHFAMLVKSDLRQPIAFAVVLGGLLSARVLPVPGRRNGSLKSTLPPLVRPAESISESTVVPIPRAEVSGDSGRWKGEMVVIEVRSETPNVRTFRLGMPDGAGLPLTWKAGQFLNLQLMIRGKRVNRSYTIASSPAETRWLELTIRKEPQGLASTWLHETVQPGDRLSVSGPAGRFVFDEKNQTQVVLIAGGVGITPVMSILRWLKDSRWTGSVVMLVSAKTEQELIFRGELEDIVRAFSNVRVEMTLTQCVPEDTWSGRRGRITADWLASCLKGFETAPVFICGPIEMAQTVRGLVQSLGVPEDRIHVEAFGGTLPPSRAAVDVSETVRSLRQVQFVRSQRTIEIDSQTTLLDAAEKHGVAIDSECRSGVCGQCRVRMLSGRVTMDCTDALTAADRDGGFILACQARAVDSVVVDC